MPPYIPGSGSVVGVVVGVVVVGAVGSCVVGAVVDGVVVGEVDDGVVVSSAGDEHAGNTVREITIKVVRIIAIFFNFLPPY
jgi:hypothetical protein